MDTLIYGQKRNNMTSSKRVRTRHHICRFLRKSLVLKIHTNTGQMPSRHGQGRGRKNMAKSIEVPF